METNSALNTLKILGCVVATIGLAVNVAMCYGLGASLSEYNFLSILGGLGVVAFIVWPISLFMNMTNVMLVCILFFCVEAAVAVCLIVSILGYVGFVRGPAYEIWLSVLVVLVMLGSFLFLSISLYLNIKENNNRLQMAQPTVETPLVS